MLTKDQVIKIRTMVNVDGAKPSEVIEAIGPSLLQQTVREVAMGKTYRKYGGPVPGSSKIPANDVIREFRELVNRQGVPARKAAVRLGIIGVPFRKRAQILSGRIKPEAGGAVILCRDVCSHVTQSSDPIGAARDYARTLVALGQLPAAAEALVRSVDFETMMGHRQNPTRICRALKTFSEPEDKKGYRADYPALWAYVLQKHGELSIVKASEVLGVSTASIQLARAAYYNCTRRPYTGKDPYIVEHEFRGLTFKTYHKNVWQAAVRFGMDRITSLRYTSVGPAFEKLSAGIDRPWRASRPLALVVANELEVAA